MGTGVFRRYWFRPPAMQLLMPSAVQAGTGSLSVVLGAATVSSTGTLLIAGTLSKTLADTTSAGTGTLVIAGTLAKTLADVTTTATGISTNRGVLGSALGDVTCTASGAGSSRGSAGITLADTSLLATSALAIKGTTSITLGNAILTAAGALPIASSASITLGSATLTSTGAVAIKGALATALDAVSSSLTGRSPPNITSAAGAANTSAATTLVSSVFDASVGDTLVVVIGADNSGTAGVSGISGVIDSSGNTYTLQTDIVQNPGINAGADVAIFTTKVSTALISGTVTVNFSTSTSAKGVQVWRVIPSGNREMQVVAADAVGAVGSSASTVAGNTVSVNADDTIIAGGAGETTGLSVLADSDTTNGSWSALAQRTATTGSNSTSMITLSQWKTVNATGNQTWNVRFDVVNADYALTYIVLKQSPTVINGAASITLGPATVTAAGTLAIKGILSATLGDVTSVATAAITNHGAAGITLAPTTLVANDLPPHGDAAITLQDLTLAATGGLAISGQASIQLANVNLFARGVPFLAGDIKGGILLTVL